MLLDGEMAKWHRGLVVLVRTTSPLAAGPQPPGSKVTRTFELSFSIDAFQAHPAARLDYFRSTMDRFIASKEVALVRRTTIGAVAKQDDPFSGTAGGSRPSEPASMLFTYMGSG